MESLERLAKNHEPCPEDASLPEQCFYWTMRAIYDSYRAKKVSKDEAKEAKRRAIRARDAMASALSRALEAYRWQQDNIRHIGGLRTAIAREEDERERLCLAICAIGAMTGDTVFVKTELRRLEEQDHA